MMISAKFRPAPASTKAQPQKSETSPKPDTPKSPDEAVLKSLLQAELSGSDDAAKVYGRIKYVDSFPDYRVKVVSAFPDLRVKKVKAFADSPGEWKEVDSFPDYRIKLVNSFADFTIKYVSAFPGPTEIATQIAMQEEAANPDTPSADFEPVMADRGTQY